MRTVAATSSTSFERMSGADAFFWHMERADTPMHTLKVIVLDPSRRDTAITLTELDGLLRRRHDLVPRLSQIVRSVPGFRSRPFWVRDDAFDIPSHLDEVTLLAPGGREQLDALCSDLAVRRLDRDRSLWAITLVHGLATGHQALVVRVHHCLMDGLASVNLLKNLTTTERGSELEVPEAPVRASRTAVSDGTLCLAALAELPAAAQRLGHLLRELIAQRRRIADFARGGDIPPTLVRRTSFNPPSAAARVCASSELRLEDLKQIARASGVSVNGVLHALLAGALRAELTARGDDVNRPLVATFGVSDREHAGRLWGNAVAPASAWVHVNLDDPERRLQATARSCRRAVELRRLRGFTLVDLVTTFTARVAPAARARVAHWVPRVVNHVTTANVPGPREERWFGDVRVAGWTSYAVAVAPADVNITAHSYGSTMSVGVVTTPEAMADPAAFLTRLQHAVPELRAAVGLTPMTTEAYA